MDGTLRSFARFLEKLAKEGFSGERTDPLFPEQRERETIMEGKKKGTIIILRDYFGYRLGEGLKDFKGEIDKLSETEKLGLARLAAKELRLPQDELDFPLDG